MAADRHATTAGADTPADPHAVALGPLASRRAAEGGDHPFLTYYGEASGERVELSHATFANWTSKTANLLVEELELRAGDRCQVLLGTHWLTVVVIVAAWRAGVEVLLGPQAGGEPDAVVVSEDRLDAATDRVDERLVVVGDGMGGRTTGTVPRGLPYGQEVPAFPDDFDDEDVEPTRPLLRARIGGEVLGYGSGDLLGMATALPPARRVLTAVPLDTVAGVVCGPVTALGRGSSLVVVSDATADVLTRRARDERADLVLVSEGLSPEQDDVPVRSVAVAHDGGLVVTPQ